MQKHAGRYRGEEGEAAGEVWRLEVQLTLYARQVVALYKSDETLLLTTEDIIMDITSDAV